MMHAIRILHVCFMNAYYMHSDAIKKRKRKKEKEIFRFRSFQAL